MDRKWREENERIMRVIRRAEYPDPDPAQVMLPLEPPVSGDAEIPPPKRPLP